MAPDSAHGNGQLAAELDTECGRIFNRLEDGPDQLIAKRLLIMARQKQVAPMKRQASDFEDQRSLSSTQQRGTNGVPLEPTKAQSSPRLTTDPNVDKALAPVATEKAGLLQLLICVGGIYASFLTWALLQERLTTTKYGRSKERWTYSIVLNTVQSTFAAISGLCYLVLSTPKGRSVPSPFPSVQILGPLLLVAVVSSLASPFGYASLAHVDYVTFILAKSCKLLPVMLLHLTVFRKRYPLYKYAVVGAVTAGVAVFTLNNPSAAAKASKAPVNSSAWGLMLLGINLLFDGLTNSTQDHIFTAFRPYTGPQMMVAQNVLATLLTLGYLLLPPFLPTTMLAKVPFLPETAGTELAEALRFLRTYPAARMDVLGFCICGAIGQLFIYATLARFSSLLLVTVTVTRKMLTMLLSVLWFGHALTTGQWLGVGLVFGGVGAEGYIARREKAAKDEEKRLAEKKSR